MPFPSEFFLFVMLVITAVLVARTTNLFAAAMLTGVFSLTCACLFTIMDAVDVAFTEAAVGGGFSTVLFLSTLALTDRQERQQPAKLYPLIVVLLIGTALTMGMMNMKPYGDSSAPIHQHVTQKIKEVEWPAVRRFSPANNDKASGHETHPKAVGLPNLVTSILASYRGYDTLGETGVIFTAGVGVMLLLMGRRKEPDPIPTNADDAEPDSDSDSAAADEDVHAMEHKVDVSVLTADDIAAGEDRS
jgi:multicomponent Na+:H+ antiporter subunit B